MTTILIDTSIIIDYLRTKVDKENSKLFKLTEGNSELAISLITYSELYSGRSVWEHEHARSELEDLFSYFQIMPFEKDTARKAGEIRAKFKINLLDAIIGATAILHNLPLATLNIKDFKQIEGIEIFSFSKL